MRSTRRLDPLDETDPPPALTAPPAAVADRSRFLALMHDALTPAFGAAALLVIAGLYLVNRPAPVVIDPLLTVTKT